MSPGFSPNIIPNNDTDIFFMKKILLGLLALCGLNIYADDVAEEDVFVDGTCWECSYTPIPPATASADNITREYLVATEEGNTGGYLELYTEHDNYPATRRRIALVTKSTSSLLKTITNGCCYMISELSRGKVALCG